MTTAGTLSALLHARAESNQSVWEVPGMAGIFFTSEGALAKATAVKAVLDGGAVRLFQSTLVPTSATTKAELEGAEADFKGYSADTGDWSTPVLEAGSGASIRRFVQFDFDSTAMTGTDSNIIGGAWIEDAATGVWMVFVLPETITVAGDGTGIPLLLVDTEGA